MSKINITIPAHFLQRVNEAAKKEHVSRSEFLRNAVEVYWEVLKAEKAEKRRIQEMKEAIRVQKRLRKKAGRWDAVAEIRRWREAH